MTWNWQSPDWPEFRWKRSRISAAEEQFLFTAGVTIGAVRHLDQEQHHQLLLQVMSREAVASSAMEGEVIDPAAVRSSLLHQLGLESAVRRRVAPAEQGAAEMMVDLYRSCSQPLSEERLIAWHGMLTSARRDPAGGDGYRTSREPMQLISGPAGERTVHFEAPPAKQLAAEMKRFIAWFNRTAAQGEAPLPAITRAGTAYLYFDSIQPFADRNGRIARTIAQKGLLQGFAQPMLVELAGELLAHQENYYRALLGANRSNEITGWLQWFAEISLQAQRGTMELMECIIAQARLLESLRGQMNERQQKALRCLFREGPEGDKSSLTAGFYNTITGASPATTTRDLADLTQKGALIRTGQKKHARYTLNINGACHRKSRSS